MSLAGKITRLPVAQPSQAYHRPPLRWITCRARCLQNGFQLARREAIRYAAIDYAWFVGSANLARVAEARRHG